MSMLAEPGTRLAGRYRLEERVSEIDASTLWRAVDEPLARPVAVRIFTEESRRASAVVAAARAASRVPDSRLAQVFDADESAEQPYLVCEWIEGDRLRDVLSRGPMEGWRAVRFITEATAAIVAAHAAGLAHLRMDSSSLIWAKGGTVKITGLAIDAALHGLAIDENAPVTDVRALGTLLYAALTARWPGTGNADSAVEEGLPPAPRTDDGWPVPVSQTRGDLPAALEGITARALGQGYGGQPPFDSPAALREALAGLPRLAPLPAQANLPWQQTRGDSGNSSPPAAAAGNTAAAGAGDAPVPDVPAEPRRPAARVLFLSAVGALVLTASALGAWQIGRVLNEPGDGGPPVAGPTASDTATTPAARRLPIQDIADVDPRDGEASPDEVNNANDNKADTAWTTQEYTSAEFGNLKPGVGLMLDMGKPVSLASVRVTLVRQGTPLVLYAGDQPDRAQMSKVASSSGNSSAVTLRPQQDVQERYFLVFLTKLPAAPDGYESGVAELTAQGTV